MTSERNREARVPTEPRRGTASGSPGNRRPSSPDSPVGPRDDPGGGPDPTSPGTNPAGTDPTGTRPTTPRTLAEELRTRPDEDLAGLLRARPDLLSPVPNDLTQLATRAGTRASVVRALERLDRFALQTAEALAVAPDPSPYATLLGLMAGDSGDEEAERELPRAIATLRAQALVWGGDDRLHLVRTARELLSPGVPRTHGSGAAGPSPTGLGPTVTEATAGMSPGRLQEIVATAGLPATHDPVTAVQALTALFSDRERMAALLAQAPEESRQTLARLVWGPPYGTVPAEPSAPVRWLIARGLLLPTAPGTVVLPREVALHLRGGRAHRVTEPVPPTIVPAAGHRPGPVDATAAGQALTALATVEDLLKTWDAGGPAVLRAGGLSVRDLKRTATALDTDEQTAAFWLELAYAAGLLASDGEADERFAPTPAYDEWLRLPAEERWVVLATAWLAATRTAGLVGAQDAKGRTLAALGPGLDRSPAPSIRRRTLELLAFLPQSASADPESLLARLRWEHGSPSGTGTAPPSPRSVTDTEPDGHAVVPTTPTGPGAGAGARARGATATGAYGGLGTTTRADSATTRADSATTRADSATTRADSAATTRAGSAASRIAAADRPSPSASAAAQGPASAEDLRSRIARWTLAEAELLGVTGRGALSAHGRALMGIQDSQDTQDSHEAQQDTPGSQPSGDPARAAALLAPQLPEPLDHVLLQADLTAVAPGPLERRLAEMLGVLADVESKGGATVYRFTPGSVRRALDAGQTAGDLHAFLAEHSRTPVPQPLSYLIDDVARKHGHLRIGAASAYVRCDDDALLAEIVADRRSAGLRLRRLAPTVLAAQATPDLLLERLREMGYAPAAESAEGDVLVTRADAHRTPPRTAPAPVPGGPPLPDHTLLGAAVRAIRAGDLAATAVRRPAPAAAAATGRTAARADSGRLPRTTSAETLATMQAAALTSSAVWIGYVNADGAASQRVIAPVRVEGGFVTAFDHTADEVRTYPLHRITGVAELADEPT
ncbi:helicase-associated domain-containing protein [Streptomyces sp. NPDC004647]|uniref:helicase-associated domain-containing protein n=1 Tax=Streptomyces sp. NPDC004647 TaxID=3154671 RepID=UPI0033A2E86E